MSGAVAWSEILDQLERELDAPIEAVEPWTPNYPGEPIPEHLVERATDIVRRQHIRATQLQEQMMNNRAQVAVLDLVPAERGATASYVDLDA